MNVEERKYSKEVIHGNLVWRLVRKPERFIQWWWAGSKHDFVDLVDWRFIKPKAQKLSGDEPYVTIPADLEVPVWRDLYKRSHTGVVILGAKRKDVGGIDYQVPETDLVDAIAIKAGGWDKAGVVPYGFRTVNLDSEGYGLRPGAKSFEATLGRYSLETNNLYVPESIEICVERRPLEFPNSWAAHTRVG